MHNDVLVMATDGLWDNLYMTRVLELLKPFARAGDDLGDLQLLAELLADEAAELAERPGYMSPFAKRARSYYHDFIRGKVDDITVIVA